VQLEDQWIVVGRVPRHRLDSFRYLQAIPFPRVVRATDLSNWPPQSKEMFYAQSWLLVHYLMYGRTGETRFSPAMTRYLGLLEQGEPIDRAFAEAFAMDLGDLQQRIENYTHRIPSYRFSRSELTVDSPVRVRPLDGGEIGVRLGWLALGTGNLDFARGLFERSGGADASSSRALAGLGDVNKFSGRYPEAEADYRASLELEPENWENHLEFGKYFLDRARREDQDRAPRVEQAREHFRRAIALAPEIPEGYAMLGMTYVVGGEAPGPGIEALEHAVALLPSHPAIHLPLAQLHARAGHKQRAVDLLRRVIQWSESPAEAQEAGRLLAELEGRSPATDED
jgi:tetratricopeptide (TPR) repeat protein